MTPSEELELLELTRDNNKILHKMKRSLVWNRVFKFIYLIIILGVTFGSYYLVQPYLDGVLGAYSSLLGGAEQVQQVGSSLPDISKILESFGGQ